jgi:hypothetical protein
MQNVQVTYDTSPVNARSERSLADSMVDDKQWAAGDAHPSSPYRGHVYAVWDKGSIAFARTTDHGATRTGTSGVPSWRPDRLRHRVLGDHRLGHWRCPYRLDRHEVTSRDDGSTDGATISARPPIPPRGSPLLIWTRLGVRGPLPQLPPDAYLDRLAERTL